MKLPKVTKSGQRHGRWYNDACGAAFAMELIGERWALLVVRELMFGPRRFSDLREQLPGISARILTERLASLEGAGVLIRRALPSPARAQVYELTPWGYRAEPILMELGRWAAASCGHDPSLPVSPVSIMLSLRTMLDPAKAAGLSITCVFTVGDESFTARLADGRMPIERGAGEGADLHIVAPGAPALAALFYGGARPEEIGVTIDGDDRLMAQFTGLFSLPEKGQGDGRRGRLSLRDRRRSRDQGLAGALEIVVIEGEAGIGLPRRLEDAMRPQRGVEPGGAGGKFTSRAGARLICASALMPPPVFLRR